MSCKCFTYLILDTSWFVEVCAVAGAMCLCAFLMLSPILCYNFFSPNTEQGPLSINVFLPMAPLSMKWDPPLWLLLLSHVGGQCSPSMRSRHIHLFLSFLRICSPAVGPFLHSHGCHPVILDLPFLGAGGSLGGFPSLSYELSYLKVSLLILSIMSRHFFLEGAEDVGGGGEEEGGVVILLEMQFLN